MRLNFYRLVHLSRNGHDFLLQYNALGKHVPFFFFMLYEKTTWSLPIFFRLADFISQDYRNLPATHLENSSKRVIISAISIGTLMRKRNFSILWPTEGIKKITGNQVAQKELMSWLQKSINWNICEYIRSEYQGFLDKIITHSLFHSRSPWCHKDCTGRLVKSQNTVFSFVEAS